MTKRKSDKSKNHLNPFALDYYSARPNGSPRLEFDYLLLMADLRFFVKVLRSKMGTKKKIEKLQKRGNYPKFLQVLIRLTRFLELDAKVFKLVTWEMAKGSKAIRSACVNCREPLGNYIQDVSNTLSTGINWFDTGHLAELFSDLQEKIQECCVDITITVVRPH